MMRYALIAVAALAIPAALAAQDGQLLNQPSANWNIYGPGQTHKGHKDKAVQGGGATRVVIPTKPANAWDIGASTPISGAIRKGDTLIFAFWARLESGGTAGKSEIAANIQRNSAPYDAIVSGRVEITSEWKLVHIQGVASADYPAGAANAALSLGSAAHTIDLGPAFIMVAK